MGELAFFAIIIFFSIVESIVRSRRAKQGGGGEGTPEELDEIERRFEWAQKDVEDLPTYDADPSYDDLPSYEDALEERPSQPAPVRRRASSETLLPGDLLEELAALAAGRMAEAERSGARTLRLPKQSPTLPKEGEATSASRSGSSGRSASRLPARRPTQRVRRFEPQPRRPEHRVHLAHAEYGTDPSERSPSEQDGLDPLAEFLDEDGRRVREALMKRDRVSLRQAVLLQEVMGPPVALRE